MVVAHTIPVIDIAPFVNSTSSEEARASVVAQVRDACITYGFFQLIGHGIPRKVQQKMLSCAKMFFDLPLEKKKEVGRGRAMGLSNRGYETIGGQQLQADALPDMKEVPYKSSASTGWNRKIC
jgi:isopenicillin N synthase-like dioxygenase